MHLSVYVFKAGIWIYLLSRMVIKQQEHFKSIDYFHMLSVSKWLSSDFTYNVQLILR